MRLFRPKKIVVSLEKYDYKPEEIIKETLKLQLKKAINACKVDVGRIGRSVQQGSYQGGMYPGSHKGLTQKTTEYVTIDDFYIPLAGEQQYLDGVFPFEMKIPPTILHAKPSPQGNATAAVNVLKSLSGMVSRIE